VTSLAADVRSGLLPAEPASVGRARRFIVDTLVAWKLEHLMADAALLVSEVATNAILHAGSVIEIAMHRAAAGVRVEVHDLSPVFPSARRYEDESMTGRGLRILDAAAAAWGTLLAPPGKTVWFELGDIDPLGRTLAVDGPADPPGASIAIRWLGLPTALARATLEHGDAMVRELALLSFDVTTGRSTMAPLMMPALDLRSLLQAIDAAIDAGALSVDLTLHLPAGVGGVALDRLALIDEADRMAVDGELLLPASLPEIAACRAWMLGEIVSQAEANAPRPWSVPKATARGERST